MFLQDYFAFSFQSKFNQISTSILLRNAVFQRPNFDQILTSKICDIIINTFPTRIQTAFDVKFWSKINRVLIDWISMSIYDLFLLVISTRNRCENLARLIFDLLLTFRFYFNIGISSKSGPKFSIDFSRRFSRFHKVFDRISHQFRRPSLKVNNFPSIGLTRNRRRIQVEMSTNWRWNQVDLVYRVVLTLGYMNYYFLFSGFSYIILWNYQNTKKILKNAHVDT